MKMFTLKRSGMGGGWVKSAALTLTTTAALSGLSGCVSSYAVDVRNQTSQPLYVQLLQRPGGGGEPVLGTMRMGPGDRAAIGPAKVKTGYAYVQLDTKPNPGSPVTLDLAPGVTILDVTQTSDGPEGQLQVREKAK